MTRFKMTKRERAQRRSARHSARTQAMEPDEPPEDMDEFRMTLARRIHMFIGERRKSWRGCPERACRRQHACLAPRNRCSNAPPSTPSTPEQTAKVMAQVQRALRQVAAQREETG